MSLTGELIDQEALMVQGGERGVIHLHREGSFYRAYEWSAYLSCRYLHEFKVNKRAFNGIEQPVVYIGAFQDKHSFVLNISKGGHRPSFSVFG